jgi:hypothetical protein
VGSRFSAEVLAQLDEAGLSERAPVVLYVADSRVEGQVLDHLLVGVEADRVEAGVASRALGVLEEGLAHSNPLMRGVDGDVLDEEALVTDSEDDQPENLAPALGRRSSGGYENNLGVVVGHRSSQPAETRDVVRVGRADQLGQARHIGCRRRPERDAAQPQAPRRRSLNGRQMLKAPARL